MADCRWSVLAALPATVLVAGTAHAADYLTAEQAQRALIPEAQSFVPYPVTLSAAQMQQIARLSGTAQRTAKPRVWRALRGGAALGWVIVDEVIGKHEYITYAAAISPDGHVIGVEILSYRESRGGQVRDPRWRARFRGKTLADPLRLNQDIPNISGATLSSRSVTDGVKRLLALHAVALAGGR